MSKRGGIKLVGDSLRDFTELVKDMGSSKILEVGISENAPPETIMKAIVNEFGYDSPGIPVTDAMRKWFAARGFPISAGTQYIKIPARPFISKGIDENLVEIWDMMDDLIQMVNDGKMNMKTALGILGAFTVQKIQEYMDKNESVPNHPLTIEQKGHSHPLLGETGSLRRSLTWDVRGGDKK